MLPSCSRAKQDQIRSNFGCCSFLCPLCNDNRLLCQQFLCHQRKVWRARQHELCRAYLNKHQKQQRMLFAFLFLIVFVYSTIRAQWFPSSSPSTAHLNVTQKKYNELESGSNYLLPQENCNSSNLSIACLRAAWVVGRKVDWRWLVARPSFCAESSISSRANDGALAHVRWTSTLVI